MTTILSWTQLVQEADPNWRYASLNPVTLEFSSGRRFRDPNPLYTPLPGTSLADDDGVLYLTDDAGYPTSPDGLPPGAVWSDRSVIAVVPGDTYPPATAPEFKYPGITASQLMLFGAGLLQATPPAAGSGLLWINGNLVCVA